VKRVARDEGGFTLVELLLVCVLMVVVLTATLTTLDSFQSNAETNSRQNDAQDTSRRAIDQLARELRNLASPTNEHPDAIKLGTAQDLIVQSVADVRPAGSANLRNTQFVRYCYDSAGQRVIRQRLTWTSASDPAVPTGTACPAGGWGSTEVVAQNVVNGVRPLFTYNSGDRLRMTEIHTSLWVDVNPGKLPAETPLSTTVFLRNQNRQPIARFSAARDGTSVVLNGSDSEDPEERALYYFWYDRAQPDKVIGTGIVYVHTPTPGKHSFFLTVKDQADLEDTAADQTLCVPGGTITC
jgi:type II secretory pathway component PulJ